MITFAPLNLWDTTRYRFFWKRVGLITVFCFWRSCCASPSNARIQKQPSAHLDLRADFAGQDVRMVGFVDQNSVILTRWTSAPNDSGHITRWQVRNSKVVVELPLSKWLDSDLCLSSDGRTLTTTNVRTNRAFSSVKAYRITTLRCSDLKIIHTNNVSANDDAVGFLPLDGEPHHVVEKMYSLIPYEGAFVGGRDRLAWLNVQTGKVDKTLLYTSTPECDAVKLSPDKKFLLAFFYSEAFNSTGESDYAPLRDQLERAGFVDVIDPKIGKILWHIAPSKKQPVGDPLFFISPTRFISSDTVFNIATKTARHWNAITPTRKCLAAVPNHPNCALFLTPGGLQLRDWQKDKTLVSWPTIKKPGRILFSPDLKMFSFKRGSLIQFWRFDPKWLR